MKISTATLCLTLAVLLGSSKVSWSGETVMNANKAQTIIQAYGAIQTAVTDYLVVDERRLPFPKGEIKKALIFAIPLVDRRMCEYLRVGYMQLAMFQPVREIRMLNLPAKLSSLSDEEIFSNAKKIEVELDSAWFAINRFVTDRMRLLLSEIPTC